MHATAISGNPRSKRNKELESAAIFFSKELMDGRLHRHVSVQISVNSKIECAAYCLPDDMEHPRDFLIALNPKSDWPMIQNLAHEMVHVAQYASKRLIDDIDNEKIIWMDEVAFSGKFDNTTEESYEMPWELEAYGLEEELYEKWIQHVAKH